MNLSSVHFIFLLKLIILFVLGTEAVNYEPIRISFDTNYLSNDPERICFKAGDRFKRGNPFSNNIICGGFEENCYGNCTVSDLVSYTGTVQYFQSLLNYAKTELEKVIKVKRMTGNLKAASLTCGNMAKLGVDVPQSMITTGVANTDLLVYVTYRPMLSNEDISTSAECLTDSTSNDRPILAHMNLNPKDFVTTNFEISKARVLHELTHIIGFTRSKIQTYKTEVGVPRTNIITSEVQVHAGESVTINFVNLPTVKSFGINYFGCSEYKGAQLEDFSGHPDHLEKRLYYNDVMTGDVLVNAGPSSMLGPFTLAILADSGFYEVLLNSTDSYSWGRGLGCKFVNERCENWAQISNIDGYFCGTLTGNDNNHCSYDFNSKGTCDAVYYSTPVRSFYQHFADPNVGGPPNSGLRDFCPLYKIVDSSDCRIDPPPSVSIDYANTGQQFSNISKCFRADLWSKSSFQVRDNKIARCHQYACSNGTALFVKIGANWVNCPSGQTISNVPGFSGSLYCPIVRQICPDNYTSPHFSTRISDPNLNNNENFWITAVLTFLADIPPYVWVMVSILAILIFFVLMMIAIWRVVHRQRKKKKEEEDAVDVEGETREYYEDQERLKFEEKEKKEKKDQALLQTNEEDQELKIVDIYKDPPVISQDDASLSPSHDPNDELEEQIVVQEVIHQVEVPNVVKKETYSDTSEEEEEKKKKKKKKKKIEDEEEDSPQEEKKKKKSKKHVEQEEEEEEEVSEKKKKKKKKKHEQDEEEEEEGEKSIKKKKSKKHVEEDGDENSPDESEKKKKKKKKKEEEEDSQETKKKKKKKKKEMEVSEEEEEEEKEKKKKKKKKKHEEEEEE